MSDIPTIAEIKAARKRLGDRIVETPVWRCRSDVLQKAVGGNVDVFFKLELFQHTGSFKARGALTTLLNLNPTALQHGVVAASAGNHAIAVSYAARAFSTTAKVVMPKTVSKIRMEKCKSYGAEVILVDNMEQAFRTMQEIANAENRTPIHPFEGPYIALGTGTIGLELVEQIKDFDAVIIPIGGGGLCGGIATAVKQLLPKCQVFGVEPTGADAMYHSFVANKVVNIEKVDTIADSLGVPSTMPYAFSLCKKYVDEVVRVDDQAMMDAMALLF